MNIRIQKIFLILMCFMPMLTFGQTFDGTGNPQALPPVGTGGFPCTGGPLESVATASGLGTAIGTDVLIENVTMDITHTWDSDIEATLISPAGTTWDLTSDNGGSGDNYTNTMFVDGAPSITTGGAPFTGMFQAEEGPFATGFDAEDPNGDWTLSICDDAGGDVGTLNSWSITFGVPCVITTDPMGAVVVDNTPGECGATLDIVAMGPSCMDPITNDFAGDDDGMGNATGEFPIGTTTVTFSSGLNTAVVEVTVVDTEGPTVDCPGDMTINLDAGECEAVLNFSFNPTDNCPLTNDVAATSNNDTSVGSITNSVACPGGGYQTFNVIDLASNGLNGTSFTSADFGVFQTFGTPTITANLYTIAAVPAAGAGFAYADLTLEATGTAVFPAGGSSIQNIEFDAPSAELSGVVVIEIVAPEGSFTNGFVPGYNNAGLTVGSTYLASDFCNTPEPTPIELVIGGFGDRMIATLNGVQAANTDGTLIAGLPNGSAFPIGTTTQIFEFEDTNGNITTCEFDVTVAEFANPSSSLACNDNVNISVDENCELVLSADIFLEGGPYGCYDNYEVNIWPFGNEAAAMGPYTGAPTVTLPCGVHVAEVVDPNTGIACWGNFTVEDKTAPIVVGTSYRVNCINEDAVPGSPSLTAEEVALGTITSIDNTVVEEVFTVAGADPSGSVSINLESDHTWVGDLVVSVTSPNGTTVDLIDNIGGPGFGCAGNGLDLTFSSTGAPYADLDGTCNNNPAAEGTFMSLSGNLAAIGSDLNGDWTVSVEDLVGGDGGDVTVSLSFDGYGEVGTPTVTEGCELASLVYSDAPAGDDCTNGTIIRTWLATDAKGNVSEAGFDTITVERIGLDGISLPPSLIQLTCGSGTDPVDIQNAFDNPLTRDIDLGPNCTIDIIERNEGTPYAYPHYFQQGCDGNLHPQAVDNNICNIYASYADQVIPACGVGCNGNVKVIRVWTLLDWCNNETVNHTQLIKAVDDAGPTFILKDVTLSTDPWGCSANVDIPQPWELHDNCTDDLTYTVSGPTGVVIVGDAESGYVALNAPKGTHTFTYTASDCCGNTTSQDATVTIYDGAAPVVVVKQNIVISLTSSQTNTEGIAKLYPGSIDNGSYDGCTDVHLEVRRDGNVGQNDCGVRGNNSYNDDNHPFDGSSNPNSPNYDPDGGAYVKFCCEDISAAVVDVDGDGTNDVGYHKVWLRVWDDGDMDGSFGSAGDNYNESWAYVKVEDKLAPAIICPPDVTLTCDMDYTDLSVTGEAQGYASCGGIDVEWNDIVNTLNTCNDMGFIRRRWNIVGRTDIFCDQRIDMTPLAGADPVVRFTPQLNDKDVTGCPEDIELSANERPTWVAGPCDVLGYTVEADTFYFEDGACLKIVREWTVINWCDYDPNNNPGAGVWRHTQVVKVTDDTQPTIESCDDLMFEINDHSDSDDDGNVCEAKITLTNIANDPGSDNCPTGWLKWQVFVDLWGDGTYDLEYSSFLPTNDGLFNDTNGNGIGDIYLEPTESGATVSVPLPDIDGSMSNHKVDWKVTDGCNNVRTCSQNFMVVDKKAPTPYCVSLSTAVMDMGADGNPGVELWASDFNVGSFDNCTAQEDLLYSFSGDSYVPNRTFGCDDVANSPVEVRMYVWDEKGNNDYCVVFLTVVDNQGLCDSDGSRMIAGGINTEAGEAVSDAEALLTAPINEYPRSQMTDEEGHYAFGSNPMGVNFTITADKDVDYLNGVSTLDLVKIQRHILGLEGLDSPYKLIAADINADDAIKANDLSQLRKLILGVITDLPTNDSWRFVDGSQDLALDMDLGTVNYEVNVDNLQSDEMNTNMVGVKVGDVTGNAVANLLAQTIEVRSSKTIDFVIENQTVKAGEEVEVTFTSADFAEVYGYQFTMELNGLEFASVQGGAVSMTDANVGVLSNKVVTVSYNTSTARTAGQDEAVFTATFVATKDGSIANMIDVTSKVTPAEAYVGESLEIRDVTISTRGDIATVATTELFQNEPNPFRGQTVVAFNLAEAAQATITVFDVTGKVIVKNNIDGVKGYNSVNFTANQFGTSGVLYYTLESGEFTATKKMIIIE